MAEYGLNKLTQEIAQQYLDELNALDTATIDGSNDRLIGDTTWWPCVADELPHRLAGVDGIPDDATMPDPIYNIKALFCPTLYRWIVCDHRTVSTQDRQRKLALKLQDK